MSVPLRPHHLFCILTYVGRGYGPAFVAIMDSVVSRLAAAELAVLVEGPDAICAGFCDPVERHCERESVLARDARALDGASTILGRRLATGDAVPIDTAFLAAMRAAFAAGTAAGRAPCLDCPWFDLCTDVAASGYRDARLVAAAA